MSLAKMVFIFIIIVVSVEMRNYNKRIKTFFDHRLNIKRSVEKSALDMWYGNKTIVDVLSQQFIDIFGSIAKSSREGKERCTEVILFFILYYYYVDKKLR